VRAVLIFIQHVETYYNGATTFAFMLLCHSPLKLTRLVFVCNSHFVAYRREVFITPMSGWLQQSSLIQLVLIIAVYLLRYSRFILGLLLSVYKQYVISTRRGDGNGFLPRDAYA